MAKKAKSGGKGGAPQRAASAGSADSKALGLSVYVDFPLQDETLPEGMYTFRVGSVPPCDRVELSIDGGPWQSCRPSEGYWWYDWFDYPRGEHRVIARATGADFITVLSDERRFMVG